MITSSERARIVGVSHGATEATTWSPAELELEPPAPIEPEVSEAVPDVAAWEARIEEAYQRGRAEGYAEGREEGLEEGRREERANVVPAVRALGAAIDAVRIEESGWLDALEKNIYALSVAIARHLIERELRTDAETIVSLIRQALTEFPLDQQLRIRLNPQDLSLITAASAAGGAAAQIAPGRNARWIPDPKIARGGFVIEGRERIVDGRIDRALERIYRELSSD